MFQNAIEGLQRCVLVVAVWSAAILVAGCGSSMKPEDFANKQPRFIIEDYFAGKTKAWGIFEDRFGNLRREFVVDITGTWDGRQLVLDERFLYSDGERETRLWTINKQDDNTYTGTAGGVVGVAKGKSYGNALQWSYDFDLKVGDGTWRVHFNDWMFLQPDGVMLNRAVVSKFGVDIGTVTLAFSKPALTQAEQRAASVANGLRVAAE
ncbi:MAG: DUF3833 domain-containing protein [Rhodospirillaceae bacterium]|nr:DUF3833 domain-containing protein [Rhodospirillaceae bacterium]